MRVPCQLPVRKSCFTLALPRRLCDHKSGSLIWGGKAMKELQKIGLGGGCHWCTEAVFQALAGVRSVEQGFMKSAAPHDSWSEAVMVEFDPEMIPLEAMIEVHLRTHASTSNHKMRGKYRSAVYVLSDGQGEQVRMHLVQLQAGFDEKLVTQILNFEGFKASDERFQNYYARNAGGPFCQAYIDPKLALLRKEYGKLLNQSEIENNVDAAM